MIIIQIPILMIMAMFDAMMVMFWRNDGDVWRNDDDVWRNDDDVWRNDDVDVWHIGGNVLA